MVSKQTLLRTSVYACISVHACIYTRHCTINKQPSTTTTSTSITTFYKKCLTVVPFIASLTACFNLFDILRLPDPTEFENSDSDNINNNTTVSRIITLQD